MPLTYSAAPIAAAAVLSGSAVKVGVIGLIRFLPFDSAMPEWGDVLVIAGLFSAFYGVVIGITQANPKTVLAYSSVSQMGLLAAALGMGLSAGEKSAVLVAAFSASFHVLVKGGLFLAIGAVASTKRSVWLVLVPATVLALGLGGLPLTGGALAKLAMKPVMRLFKDDHELAIMKKAAGYDETKTMISSIAGTTAITEACAFALSSTTPPTTI